MKRVALAALILLMLAVPALAQSVYAAIPNDGSTTSDPFQSVVMTFTNPSVVDPASIQLYVNGVAYTTSSSEVTWAPANLYFTPSIAFPEGEVICSLAVVLDWAGDTLVGIPYVFSFFVDSTGPRVISRGLQGVDPDTFPMVLGPNTFDDTLEAGDTIVGEWYIVDDYSDLDPLTIEVVVNGITYTYPSPELEWENDIVIAVDTLLDSIVGTDTFYTYIEHHADHVKFYLTSWSPMDTIWMALIGFDDTPDYGTPNSLLDSPDNAFFFYLDYLGPNATVVSPTRFTDRVIRTSCGDLGFAFDIYDENGIDPSTMTFQFRGTTLDDTSPMVGTSPIWDYAATYWHIFVPDTFFRVIWPQRDFYWRSSCVIQGFVVDTIYTATDTIIDTLFFVNPLTPVDGWWSDNEAVINNRAHTIDRSAEISDSLYSSAIVDRYSHCRIAVVWNNDTGLDFNPFFGYLNSEFYHYQNYDTAGCGFGDGDMTDDTLEVLFVSTMDPDIYYIYDTIVATYDEIPAVAKNIYCMYGWGNYSGTFDLPSEYPSPLHPIMTTTSDLAQVGTRISIIPNPPIYEGETLHVELLTCDDVFGNHIQPNDVYWDVTADRSAPYLISYTPIHNTITMDTLMPISVTIGDEYGIIDPFTLRMRIEYSGGVIDIDSLPAPLPLSEEYTWNWDASTGTGVFTYYPERAGIHWAQGDTIIVVFYDISDSIDICGENHFAYEYDFVTWTFFTVAGPYVQSVEPANGTFTACPTQNVIFQLFDPDGINASTVLFEFEGKVYNTTTVDTSIVCHWLHTGPDSVLLSCDTTIYTPLQSVGGGYFQFDPPAGTYYDGRQIDCAILQAEDMLGNPLWYVGDYAWHYTCDFTGPVYYDPQPALGTYASGEHLIVSIAIDDSISAEIATQFVTLSVDGIIYSPVTDPVCVWDGNRLSIDLGYAGVTFPDGAVVQACLENLYDGVDYFCSLYPNAAAGTPYCWNFVIDNQPPVATLLEPFDLSTTACANQPIKILLQDNLGVDPATIMLIVEGIIYTVDDIELGLVGDTLVFTPSVPYGDGDIVDFSLAQVGDIAGNIITSGVGSPLPTDIEFTTDLTAPEVIAVNPEPDAVVTDAITELELVVYDLSAITDSTASISITVATDVETTIYVFPYEDTSGIWDIVEVTPTDYLFMINLELAGVFFPSRGANVAVEFTIQDAPDFNCFAGAFVGNETVYDYSFDITPGWRLDLDLVPVVWTYDTLTGDTIWASGDTGVLVMGAAYGATDDFDSGIDEMAPPLPPDTSGLSVVPPSFLLGSDRLTKDIKSLDSTEPIWLVWTGTTAGTLWWDTSAAGLPEYGAFVINGYIDMRSTDHYAYDAAEAIFINFTPEFITLYTGWNLVSVPVNPTDPTPSAVFNVPDYQVFWYNPWSMAYEHPTIIHPGYAYFVLYIPEVGAPDEITFSVPGAPIYEYTIDAPLGWVTMGSVYDFGGVDWTTGSHVTTIPADALWGVYSYNSATDAYDYAPAIYAGEGYWAYITLPSGYSSASIDVKASWLKAGEYKDPLSADDIANLDIDGAKLVLAVQSDATNSPDRNLDWLLPPALVNETHSAYLLDDNMQLMRDVRPDAEWTLVLTKDALVKTDRTIAANGIIIEDSKMLAAGTYKVTFSGGALPKMLALHQNNPNPFNPVTDITFDLPKDSDVKLEVFNMLGQRISSLIDGDIAAGTHSVRWNGKDSNDKDAATGVYFYKLTTDGQTLTRKMILLR
ncbi:T9SS type A sorting domain-containing protein [bacterium]|nr:T9SS type A sorting domain-containing protein [bacterium]